MTELFEVSFSGLDFWLNMLDRVKQVYAQEASPKGGRRAPAINNMMMVQKIFLYKIFGKGHGG